MLIGTTADAEPAVVGEIEQPARPFVVRYGFAGKDDLVAEERQHPRRAGHRHGAAPLAGDEAARQLGELHQA